MFNELFEIVVRIDLRHIVDSFDFIDIDRVGIVFKVDVSIRMIKMVSASIRMLDHLLVDTDFIIIWVINSYHLALKQIHHLLVLLLHVHHLALLLDIHDLVLW